MRRCRQGLPGSRPRTRRARPIVPVSMAEERATNPFLRAVEPSVKEAVGLPGGDDAAVFARGAAAEG